MRRILPSLLLVATACVAQPPERSPLPDVGEVVPEPIGCQVSVGEPSGVKVVSVLPDTPAVGVFQEQDLIIEIDGTAIDTRPALFELMNGYAPGDTIEITYIRGDDTMTDSVTLTANPSDGTRPLIGLTLLTAFTTISLEEANDIVEPSRAARPLDVGGQIYLFDPLANTWQPLGISPPDDARWASTSTGIYSVTGTDTVQILDLITGGTIEDDGFEGWELRRLMGAVGDDLIVLITSEVLDQPGFINLAIAGFDPLSAETLWISPISTTFGVPVSAIGSLDDSAFLLIGVGAETGEESGFAVYNSRGMPQEATISLELGEPIGWFDVQSMAFQTGEDMITVANLIDGSSTTYPLPQGLIGASAVATVGDGQHIIAISGRNLMLHDLANAGDSQPVATNCAVGQTGDPGWGL
jgi:hypothetical protein